MDSDQDRRTFAIYCITKHGVEIGTRLYESLPNADLLVSRRVRAHAPEYAKDLPLPFGPLLADTFHRYDAHIFVISVGAVVRMVAPHMKNKKVDPAVVCVDDASRFSVCVLSGHVGRGNEYCDRVAGIIGAQSVVTTASDVQGTLRVDILGRELGWVLDDLDRNVTLGCAAVVNQERVAFVQETGEPNWWPQPGGLPPGVELHDDLNTVKAQGYSMLLVASDREFETSHPAHWAKSVIYRPKSLVLGLGCDKNTPAELVERGILERLQELKLSSKCVLAIASIDIKASEPAFLEMASRHNWEFVTYPAEQLNVVEGIENPSEVVLKYTGSRSVAEAACLQRSGAKTLLAPKKSYTEEGAGRSMTMSVARIPFEKRTQGGA